MKWILMALLFVSGTAHATLIRYTFHDMAIWPTRYYGDHRERSDMVVTVSAQSQQIIGLTYSTSFFNIDYHGQADITADFRGENYDGSGYYAFFSTLWGALPDGGSMTMYIEASMPIDANPSYYLDAGYDGQFFSFTTNDGASRYMAEWMITEKVLVPEPSTLALLSLGLAGIGLRRKRRLS